MGRLAPLVRDLPPGAFAVVMATGIISIAADRLGLGLIAWPLLGLNGLLYVSLWLLLGARLRWYPVRIWADLGDPSRGPGCLTLVAGTCVLATQVLVLTGDRPLAGGLAVLGALLWPGLSYTFLATIVTRGDKPGLAQALNGSWLLLVVDPQALSVLASLLGPDLPAADRWLFGALALFLLGCLLYVVLIGLVVSRLIFVPLRPADFSPDYWISMGAAAITTLAGATLITSAEAPPLVTELRPIVEGASVLFWAVATWWVPLLAALDVWRHRPSQRQPFGVGAAAWGRVFPLGMYAMATLALAEATGLAWLLPLAAGMLAVALLVWLLTLVAQARALLARLLSSPGP